MSKPLLGSFPSMKKCVHCIDDSNVADGVTPSVSTLVSMGNQFETTAQTAARNNAMTKDNGVTQI